MNGPLSISPFVFKKLTFSPAGNFIILTTWDGRENPREKKRVFYIFLLVYKSFYNYVFSSWTLHNYDHMRQKGKPQEKKRGLLKDFLLYFRNICTYWFPCQIFFFVYKSFYFYVFSSWKLHNYNHMRRKGKPQEKKEGLL